MLSRNCYFKCLMRGEELITPSCPRPRTLHAKDYRVDLYDGIMERNSPTLIHDLKELRIAADMYLFDRSSPSHRRVCGGAQFVWVDWMRQEEVICQKGEHASNYDASIRSQMITDTTFVFSVVGRLIKHFQYHSLIVGTTFSSLIGQRAMTYLTMSQLHTARADIS